MDTKIVQEGGKLILRRSDASQAEEDERLATVAEIAARYSAFDGMSFVEAVQLVDQRKATVLSNLDAATSLAEVKPVVETMINDLYEMLGPWLAYGLTKVVEKE